MRTCDRSRPLDDMCASWRCFASGGQVSRYRGLTLRLFLCGCSIPQQARTETLEGTWEFTCFLERHLKGKQMTEALHRTVLPGSGPSWKASDSTTLSILVGFHWTKPPILVGTHAPTPPAAGVACKRRRELRSVQPQHHPFRTRGANPSESGDIGSGQM